MDLSWLTPIIKNPQWATVIVMFLAVLVALFGKSFIDWLQRPKIRFGLGNKEPYVITYYTSSLMPKIFRLKVINEGGTVAKNCRVKVISVSPTKDLTFEPDVLKWSNAPRDMGYRIDPSIEIDNITNISNLPPIYREQKDISPNGGWEFCDLFLSGAGGDTIKFSSFGNREFVTYEDNYIVGIEISGDNLKPRKAKFKISPSGDFNRVKIGWV